MTDQELLSLCNEYLDCNPLTGILTWKKRLGYKVKVGDSAGYISDRGYHRIKLKGHRILAHRVIFLLYYNYLPKNIDHINGVKNDNRIINLRDTTTSENLRNVGPQRNNTSGYKGVSQRDKKWKASICYKKHSPPLGSFVCPHYAARVWNTAARMYHGHNLCYTNLIAPCNCEECT